MTRYARVDQAQVAVGAATQQGDRCGDVVRALCPGIAGNVGITRRGHEQPGPPGAAVLAWWRCVVTVRTADLTALHRGAADDSGPDPEHPLSEITGRLEPD